jgi:hypothetical protein
MLECMARRDIPLGNVEEDGKLDRDIVERLAKAIEALRNLEE